MEYLTLLDPKLEVNNVIKYINEPTDKIRSE